MISIEQKVILDLVREQNTELYKIMDEKKFIEELLKHRMLLCLYDKSRNILSPINQKILQKYREQYLKHKNNKEEFFINFVQSINESKIPFIVLKGFATEIDIYNNTTSRMFGDIDIFVEKENFELMINYIKLKYPNAIVQQESDYYAHELRITITENDESYLVEIKRRHRGCDYTLNKFFFSNIKYLYYKGIDIPVLNDTSLFISYCYYLYNYFTRKTAYIHSKKNRLCYFYDFYQLIKKINNKPILNDINEEIIPSKIVYKVMNWTAFVFNDSNMIIENENEKQMFNIIDCIFNSEYIANIYKNLYINSNESKGVSEFRINYCDNYITGNINIVQDKIHLKFNLNDLDRDGTKFLYLRLYGINKYGESLYPFMPFSIRIFEKHINIYQRFTLDDVNGKFLFDREKPMPYHKEDLFQYNLNEDFLDITIDLNLLEVIPLKDQKFYYNIDLSSIMEDGTLKVIGRVNDDVEETNTIKASI